MNNDKRYIYNNAERGRMNSSLTRIQSPITPPQTLRLPIEKLSLSDPLDH